MFEICFSTAVKYKGYYYLAGQNVSGLFRYCEEKKELDYLFSFLNDGQYRFQYYLSFLFKNTAWFIPYYSDDIAVVNLDDASVEYVPIDYNTIFNKTRVKFINYCIFNDHFVFLVPQDIDSALIIDLETYEKTVIRDVSTPKKSFSSAVYVNKELFLYPWEGNAVNIIDLNTKQIREQRWDEGNCTYGDCLYDMEENMLIHAPVMATDILIENCSDSTKKRIAMDNSTNEREYFFLTKYEGDYLIWGLKKGAVVKYSTRKDKMEEYLFSKKKNDYLFPITSDDETNGSEALLFNGNKIIRYKDNGIDIIEIKVTSAELKECLQRSVFNMGDLFGRFEQERLYEEGKEIGLDEFINAIAD